MIHLKRQLRLEEYGASLDGTGIGDDDALAEAVSDAQTGKWSSCRIGWCGALVLSRQTPPLFEVHLEGDDRSKATVRKRYPGGVLFYFRAPPGELSGGGLHNFSVPKDVGSAGSYVILARATADWAPSGLQLEHLYLSSGTSAAPFRNIELDGTRRVPLGIRQVRIWDVTCFGSASPGNVVIRGTRDTLAIGLRLYPAGGRYADLMTHEGNPGFMELGGQSAADRAVVTP